MKRVRKSNKRAIITKAVVILSAAAIVSTGFAAWIISGNDSKEVGGNFKVDAAQNQIHTITFTEGANANKNIVFGQSTAAAEYKNTWLTYTGSAIGTESLSFTFDFVVHNWAANDKTAGQIMEAVVSATDFVVTYAEGAGTSPKTLDYLISNDYVLPFTFTYTINGSVDADTGNSALFQYPMRLTVSTGWGTYFREPNSSATTGVNPQELDVANAYTNEQKVAVMDGLNMINDALNGATFTLTIKSK